MLQQETGQERAEYFSLEDNVRPYFCLEEERGKQYSRIEKGLAITCSMRLLHSFAVYEELMLTRGVSKRRANGMDTPPTVDTPPTAEGTDLGGEQTIVDSIRESTYVNPKPGCSLINPNTRMREHMERMGVYKRVDRASTEYDLPSSNNYDGSCNLLAEEEDLYHSHEDHVLVSDDILDCSDEGEDEEAEDLYHCNDEDVIVYEDDVLYRSNEDLCIDRDLVSTSDSEGIYDDIIVNRPLLLYNKQINHFGSM